MKVALVGLGMAVTPHAKSLSDLKNRVEVAYAYSPSAARRAAFGKRFAFPQCDRLETILEDRSIDAVLLLTPPNTHLELVSRFRPVAEELREIVSSGKLGKLLSASAIIPVWRPQSYYDQPGRGTRARDGGGVLLTQGIHTLDLLLSFAGEAAEVKSFSTTTPVHRMETEDLACAAVRWKSGALGVVYATTAAYPGFAERIELIGTSGTAVLEGTSLQVRFQDGGDLDVKTEAGGGGTGADPMAFPHDWHRSVLSDFLDAIEQDRPPRVSGAEALKVHRFIDALLQAPRSGG